MRAGRDGDEKKMADRLRSGAWYSRGVERSRWENEDEGRYLCCRRRIGFGALKGLNLKVPTPYNRTRNTRLLVYVYERASLCMRVVVRRNVSERFVVAKADDWTS